MSTNINNIKLAIKTTVTLNSLWDISNIHKKNPLSVHTKVYCISDVFITLSQLKRVQEYCLSLYQKQIENVRLRKKMLKGKTNIENLKYLIFYYSLWFEVLSKKGSRKNYRGKLFNV